MKKKPSAVEMMEDIVSNVLSVNCELFNAVFLDRQRENDHNVQILFTAVNNVGAI